MEKKLTDYVSKVPFHKFSETLSEQLKELKSNIDKLLDKAKAEDKVIEIKEQAKQVEGQKNFYYGQGNPVAGFIVRKIFKLFGKET